MRTAETIESVKAGNDVIGVWNGVRRVPSGPLKVKSAFLRWALLAAAMGLNACGGGDDAFSADAHQPVTDDAGLQPSADVQLFACPPDRLVCQPRSGERLPSPRLTDETICQLQNSKGTVTTKVAGGLMGTPDEQVQSAAVDGSGRELSYSWKCLPVLQNQLCELSQSQRLSPEYVTLTFTASPGQTATLARVAVLGRPTPKCD